MKMLCILLITPLMLSSCARDDGVCFYRIDSPNWEGLPGHVNDYTPVAEALDRLQNASSDTVKHYYIVGNTAYTTATCNSIMDLTEGIGNLIIVTISEEQYMGLVES